MQTDSSQNVSSTTQYDAFGNLVSSTGSPQGPLGFNGQYGYQTDQDTGFQLLGHRYYDPSTGRFLTRDPAKDGQNWYDYCRNNPLCWQDPRGLAGPWAGPEQGWVAPPPGFWPVAGHVLVGFGAVAGGSVEVPIGGAVAIAAGIAIVAGVALAAIDGGKDEHPGADGASAGGATYGVWYYKQGAKPTKEKSSDLGPNNGGSQSGGSDGGGGNPPIQPTLPFDPEEPSLPFPPLE